MGKDTATNQNIVGIRSKVVRANTTTRRQIQQTFDFGIINATPWTSSPSAAGIVLRPAHQNFALVADAAKKESTAPATPPARAALTVSRKAGMTDDVAEGSAAKRQRKTQLEHRPPATR